MAGASVVQPMTHGPWKCCTTHGAWVTEVLYTPWSMGNRSVVHPMTHGWCKCCTAHNPWVAEVLYNPWGMGNRGVVQPMTHGPWVIQVLYNPWVMGHESAVQPMGHGQKPLLYMLYNPCPMGILYCCTTHDPWAFYTVVQRCMAHGSRDLVTLYGPSAMGKSRGRGS